MEEEQGKDKWGIGKMTAALMGMIGFEPTGREQAEILKCRKRYKLVVGGGQAGKSMEASADFMVHMIDDMERRAGEELLYWLVAADYERTRSEFEYIQRFLRKLGLPVVSSKRVDPGYIEVRYPGERVARVRVETKSGKDPRTLAMFAPNGIIGCEASQIDLETYQKCLERLAGKGGWLHLSGTYEGSLGWYPSLAKAWMYGSADEQSFILPATSNRYLYPGGEKDPKILRLKSQSSDSFFMERIMGIAAPPHGMVFANEFRSDIHIRPLKYNPELPIYIWDDPGYGHAHAIEIAQIVPGGQVHVFYELYRQGVITEDLIDQLLLEEWWKNPNKTLVIDPNYDTQHHATHSVAEIWLEKTGLTSHGTKVKISEGTERLKGFLKVNAVTGEPGIVFDPSCKGVLSELGAYPNPFDMQTKVYSWKMDRDGNVVGDEPDDRYNDGIKAIIYGLVERFGLVSSGERRFFTVRKYGSPEPRRQRRLLAGARSR